jgi:hypothetical protein
MLTVHPGLQAAQRWPIFSEFVNKSVDPIEGGQIVNRAVHTSFLMLKNPAMRVKAKGSTMSGFHLTINKKERFGATDESRSFNG